MPFLTAKVELDMCWRLQYWTLAACDHTYNRPHGILYLSPLGTEPCATMAMVKGQKTMTNKQSLLQPHTLSRSHSPSNFACILGSQSPKSLVYKLNLVSYVIIQPGILLGSCHDCAKSACHLYIVVSRMASTLPNHWWRLGPCCHVTQVSHIFMPPYRSNTLCNIVVGQYVPKRKEDE